ncbi:hypothetical protein Ddye_026456 [Dipteronia dyeriana]|uniref:Uncharacterized protein n=1 Tax=Dipteronia dyeriana TaxID=168575 RepID=A0AAD9TMR3_9ROSI|nr:hypothetical protein Ddye_026456 [Dipteronia dyeriana]
MSVDLGITELLEAVRALPDVLDAVVKREVSNLPGVLRSLMQEIQSTRGQSNQEHVDAYMSYLAKRQESDLNNYRHNLVLLSSEFYDWIDYGCGNRPGWGQPWWLYT